MNVDNSIILCYNKAKREDNFFLKGSERETPKNTSYDIIIKEGSTSIEEQIRFYCENGMSFMLHGLSGIGKSARVIAVDPDLVSITLRDGMLPEEITGKTIYPNNETKEGGIWVPPFWYVELCKKCEEEPDKYHVLFIDEVTNVKPTTSSLIFNIVQYNTIAPNQGSLPKNVFVALAGNSKDESEAANNMAAPLFRKIVGHVYIPLDVKEWVKWGTELNPETGKSRIHPIVSGFVLTYGKEVFYTKYDNDDPPEHAVERRGWEQLSDMI